MREHLVKKSLAGAMVATSLATSACTSEVAGNPMQATMSCASYDALPLAPEAPPPTPLQKVEKAKLVASFALSDGALRQSPLDSPAAYTNIIKTALTEPFSACIFEKHTTGLRILETVEQDARYFPEAYDTGDLQRKIMFGFSHPDTELFSTNKDVLRAFTHENIHALHDEWQIRASKGDEKATETIHMLDGIFGRKLQVAYEAFRLESGHEIAESLRRSSLGHDSDTKKAFQTVADRMLLPNGLDNLSLLCYPNRHCARSTLSAMVGRYMTPPIDADKSYNQFSAALNDEESLLIEKLDASFAASDESSMVDYTSRMGHGYDSTGEYIASMATSDTHDTQKVLENIKGLPEDLRNDEVDIRYAFTKGLENNSPELLPLSKTPYVYSQIK